MSDSTLTPGSVPPEPVRQPPSTDTPPAFIDDVTGELEPFSAPILEKPIAPLPAGSKKAQRALRKSTDQSAQRAEKTQGAPIRKAERKRNYTLITLVSTLRSLVLVFAVAVIVGTIFTSFTSNASLSPETLSNLAIAQVTEAHSAVVPTDLPTPVWFKRIGIIPGHSGIAQRGTTKGNVDPGSVCDDGFTEASVTLKVGQQVIANLRGRGYTVDQLDEWDMRLDELNPYDASVLLSIHADSCTNFNDGYPHSGFKVVNPLERATVRDQDLRLIDCLRTYYGQATGLAYSGWSITPNMTHYHAFREITQRTPAGIIELGFLFYDRDLLEHHADKAIDGITNGLLCFLDPKSLATSVPTLAPTIPTTPIQAVSTKLGPTGLPTPSRH